MPHEKGVVEVYFGGSIVKSPRISYEGGQREEMVVDTDKASYAEIRYLLKENGYEEPNFRIYYKVSCSGLKVLYTDPSSLELAYYVGEYGVVEVYVSHGVNINVDFLGLKNSVDEVNEVYVVGVGCSNAAVNVNEESIENFDVEEEVDVSRNSYEASDSEDVDYVAEADVASGDSDDDELQIARNNRKQVDDAKRKGVGHLFEEIEKLENLAKELKGTCSVSKFDEDDEAGSEDSYETDDDGEQRRIQSQKVMFKDQNKIPVFALHMCFSGGHKQFKQAIDNYAIHSHRQICLPKNDKQRVRAVCIDPCCPWVCYGSYDARKNFLIKTFIDVHTCSISFRNLRLTKHWLSENYKKHFRVMPSLKTMQFKLLVQEELGVTVSLDKCRKAKKICMYNLYGDVAIQYKRLWDYVEEMKTRNPESTIEMVVEAGENGEQVFKRLYVCFAAVKQGFKEGCRKVIGVDGCFLKGLVIGEILAAVGRDSNNQMYPIAWAQVEVENYSSWSWFLQLLSDDLGIGVGLGWVMISDQQKGLLSAIGDVLPYIEHRCCARHVFCNWRKTNRGKEIGKVFWKCVKANNIPEFEQRLAELRLISATAVDDILKIHPQHWCKAYFGYDTVCDIVDNNLCEAFNGAIVNSRDKPIVELFGDIRVLVMTRLPKRHREILKWDKEFGPRIRKNLEVNKVLACMCTVVDNGAGTYEVSQGEHRFVVDVLDRTCSCRSWKLSGIPCAHACASIFKLNEEPDGYVHECLSRTNCLKAYEPRMLPLVGRKDWIQTNNPDVTPPGDRPMPGRPKKKRVRDPYEKQLGIKLGNQMGRQKSCSLCKGLGHNKLTCLKNTKKKGNDAEASGSNKTVPKKKRSKIEQVPATSVSLSGMFPLRSPTKKRSNMKRLPAAASTFTGAGLAPQAIPPGHAQYRRTGVVFNPSGRQGVTATDLRRSLDAIRKGKSKGTQESVNKK